jgi:hypothetical protein
MLVAGADVTRLAVHKSYGDHESKSENRLVGIPSVLTDQFHNPRPICLPFGGRQTALTIHEHMRHTNFNKQLTTLLVGPLADEYNNSWG